MHDEDTLEEAEAKTLLLKIALFSIIMDAGDMLKRFFASGRCEVSEEGGVDFAAEADLKVDEFIRAHLQTHFPSAAILTKGTAGGNDFSSFATAEECWIADPLGGSGNFYRGNKNFSISIARVKKGVPALGIVYLPVDGKIYWAQASWNHASLNGQRIKVSQNSELRKLVVGCEGSSDLENRKAASNLLDRLAPKVGQIKYVGSVCADLCKLAEGNLDAFLHPGLKPWNTAAAGLICQRAGASVRTIMNSPHKWSPFDSTIFAVNNADTEMALVDLF